MIYSMSDLKPRHYSAIHSHTLMYVLSPYLVKMILCLILLMPRDYYIKMNLFKYPLVTNPALNHLVDKSVNQSIKNQSIWD